MHCKSATPTGLKVLTSQVVFLGSLVPSMSCSTTESAVTVNQQGEVSPVVAPPAGAAPDLELEDAELAGVGGRSAGDELPISLTVISASARVIYIFINHVKYVCNRLFSMLISYLGFV